MGLEKFEETGQRRGTTEPRISLRKSGSIGLNQPAIEEYFEDTDYVNLYFDEDENRVGLEPLDGQGPHSYKLNKTNEYGASITPSAFLRKYDLVPEQTTRYIPEWDDDEDIVVFDLDEPESTYGLKQEEEGSEQAESGE